MTEPDWPLLPDTTPTTHDVAWTNTHITDHCTHCPPHQCPLEQELLTKLPGEGRSDH